MLNFDLEAVKPLDCRAEGASKWVSNRFTLHGDSLVGLDSTFMRVDYGMYLVIAHGI